MYVFHTNQIWDSIKDQSNCGLFKKVMTKTFFKILLLNETRDCLKILILYEM